MKYRRKHDAITAGEIPTVSKTKSMFVDGPSASRSAISDNDAMLNGDILAVCDYSLAKGHTKRLYNIIAGVKFSK